MEKLSLPQSDRQCGISFLHQKSVSETYHIHTHDFYEIFYVAKGRAMHNINGESECCTAGTLQLIRPADCHAYSFINRYDMELISIGISREIMQQIAEFCEMNLEEIESRAMPLSAIFDANRAESVLRAVAEIGKIEGADKRRAYVKPLIACLLHDLMDMSAQSAKIPAWLDTLIAEMNVPENYKAGLKRMVELSHVTQNHLNREMKKYLGMTPTEFINSRRIALAADLLLENAHSITEIAELCGFETLSNFYDNFNKFCQCSPKEFIARHKSI